MQENLETQLIRKLILAPMLRATAMLYTLELPIAKKSIFRNSPLVNYRAVAPDLLYRLFHKQKILRISIVVFFAFFEEYLY